MRVQLGSESLSSFTGIRNSACADVAERMAALEAAGLIYAAEHWRAGRYLYLIYPMVDGVRPSPTYIGSDPARIAAAQAGIERGARFESYKQEASRLAGQAGCVARQLRALLADLNL